MRPKISVVICAFNEEKLLPHCLRSLQEQSYPKNKFEVILVDNGSQDKTAAIGRAFGIRVYSYAKMQGISAARKHGADRARGSIIAFTDADSFVPSDWLVTIDKLLSSSLIVCVGGPGRSAKKSVWQDIIYVFYDFFYSLNHFFHKPILWGFNMAVKKNAYEAIGGINDRLLTYEDWDLAFRLQRRFGQQTVRYRRELFVYTSTRKQDNMRVLIRYAIDGFTNYVNFVILGRMKSRPLFNVR